ncbi:inosine-uridine preferring nucleoside hydrolase family protein [Chlamydoabsidia padenii]|nr:inosine-uridine preferring nucleoside hydrolase family protein [Chlamydoabsidia padenii]
MASPTPLWLDCDPGHDDAMAIILAGYNPNLRLLGISTTHGNQDHDKISRNAAVVLKAAGIDHVRIVPGQTKPLTQMPLSCPDIHGDSGLDGTTGLPCFDPLLVLKDEKAVLYLAHLLQTRKEAGEVPLTLIATGPLTNYALLLTLYPELCDQIKQIIFMGGSIGPGNWTPCAEYNILVDPEAASIVFRSDIDVTMVPLEVTHQAIVTDAYIERLQTQLNHSHFCRVIVDLLLFFKKTYYEVFDFRQGPPLHDPCAVAVLCAPNLFKFKRMGVHVITSDGPCLGQTVCDIYRRTDSPQINVATDIQVDGFMDMLLDAFDRANQRSPLNATI